MAKTGDLMTTERDADLDLLDKAITTSGLTFGRFSREVLLRDEVTVRRWLKGENPMPAAVRDWLHHQQKKGLPIEAPPTPRQAGSERVMEKIVELHKGSPLREAGAVTFRGLVQGVPFVGDVVGEWLGELRQRQQQERFVEVLWAMSDAIGSLERRGKVVQLDEAFAERTMLVGELAVRSNAEDKRKRFAWLLANSATEEHANDRNDAVTMARLLDQLDLSEVLMLHRLVAGGNAAPKHGVWGESITIVIGDEGGIDFHTAREGEALLRLHAAGLIRADQFRNPSAYTTGRVVEVVDLGVRLDRWIQDPSGQKGTAAVSDS
jgi:hypothetical protein